MQLTVSLSDGREEKVHITPGDLVAFERFFDISWDEVQQKPRMDHVMFLAYNGLRRTKGLPNNDEGRPVTYEQFLDQVEDFDSAGDASRPPVPPPPPPNPS